MEVYYTTGHREFVPEVVAEISLSRCRMGRYVNLHLFLTSALDGSRGGWSASRADRSVTVKRALDTNGIGGEVRSEPVLILWRRSAFTVVTIPAPGV